MNKLITGIGGVFFRSNNSKALAIWYEEHLGINSMESSSIWQQEAGPTVFAPFKADTTYFGKMEQQFMLNLRVTDFEKLLDQLSKAGVKIEEEQIDESYGKFAWIYDPEGNKIELWQPKEEV